MRDIDIINKAMGDAQAVLHDYVEPRPRDPHAVLLDRIVAAEEQLRKGYRRLRIVG
jgi:hypothetical protein